MDPIPLRQALRKQKKEEYLKYLIVGILRQAALDIKSIVQGREPLYERLQYGLDAMKFLDSDTFSLICDALQVSESKMRNEMIRRTKRGDLDEK